MIQFLKSQNKKHRKLDLFVVVLFVISSYLLFINREFPYLVSTFIFLCYLILKTKMLLIGLILFSIILFVHYVFGAKNNLSYVNGVYKIIDTTSLGPIIKVQGNKILLKSYEQFYIGNYVNVSGNLSAPQINSNGFNLPLYLSTLNIKTIYEGEIQVVSEGNDIRMMLIKYLNASSSLYKKYAPLLIVGEKGNDSKEVYKIALEMNVVHLFVISGFHLSLLNKIVCKSLNAVKVKEKHSEFIALLFILFYIYLLNSSTSSLRAFLLIFYNYINKHFLKKKITGLNVLNYVTITMFIFAPWSIMSLSFIYTFVATYVVIYVNSLKFKNDLRKWVAVSFFAFISTMPISVLSNGYFSIFSLFFGIALSPVFVVYYILTITLFPFKELLNYLYYLFDFILLAFNEINIKIQITFLTPTNVYYIYIILITFIIINRKWNTYMDKKI